VQKFFVTIKGNTAFLPKCSQGFASDNERSGKQRAAFTIMDSPHFSAQYAVRTIIDSLHTGLQCYPAKRDRPLWRFFVQFGRKSMRMGSIPVA